MSLENSARLDAAYADWEQSTNRLMQLMPHDYKTLSHQLLSLDFKFREHLAHSLEPALNSEAQLRLHETSYRKLQKEVEWFNEQASQFGLAFVSKKLDSHAVLAVEPIEDNSKQSALFFFETDTGKRWTRTDGSHLLPKLHLRPSSLANPIWSRLVHQVDDWTQRVEREPASPKGNRRR